MNTKNKSTRVLCLLTLLVATVMLFVAVGSVSGRLGMEKEPGVPANTVIESWGDTPVPSEQFHPNPSGLQPGLTAPSENAQVTSLSDAAVTTTTATTTTTPAPVTTTTTYYSGDRKECSGWLTVKTPTANVRTDADKNATLVAVINAGERYEVIAQKCSSTGILWLEIKLGDTTGYVAGSYVEYDGPIIGGKAYLTFDDGPSANTWRILEILDRYNVKATFFVIHHGGQDDAYRAIVERGHTIALHSYSHSYSKIYTSAQAYFDDLKQLDKQVYDLTGVHSSIIRFPGGTSNAISAKYCKGVMTEIAARAQRDGYFYFDWNVDSGDADDVTVPADTILNNIKRNIGSHRQAVILMHDAKAKTTTADALPYIIEYLQSRGYEILPLTEDTPPVHHNPSN